MAARPALLGATFFIIVLAILGAPRPSRAGRTAVPPALERFSLYASCQPMNLVVETLHPNAATFGLRKDAIQAAVESRLRSARIYDSDAGAYLYVNVNTVGAAFGIDLEYRKRVLDVVSQEMSFAATWTQGITGTHSRNASYILSNISQAMDSFLSAWLRVNEEACRTN